MPEPQFRASDIFAIGSVVAAVMQRAMLGEAVSADIYDFADTGLDLNVRVDTETASAARIVVEFLQPMRGESPN